MQLLVTATVMLGLADLAGAGIPWWIVVTPVMVPAVLWALKSVLALVVIGGARVAGRARK